MLIKKLCLAGVYTYSSVTETLYDMGQLLVSVGLTIGESRIDLLTVFSSNFNCMRRLLQIRSGHHELGATNITGSLDHIIQIILMRLLAMIPASKHGITQVDPNLDCCMC